MEYSIKELVSGGNRVKFVKYFDGQLWYDIVTPAVDGHSDTLLTFTIPVPTPDIGNAAFLAEDKAILFMRYIRKYLDSVQKAKETQ